MLGGTPLPSVTFQTVTGVQEIKLLAPFPHVTLDTAQLHPTKVFGKWGKTRFSTDVSAAPFLTLWSMVTLVSFPPRGESSHARAASSRGGRWGGKHVSHQAGKRGSGQGLSRSRCITVMPLSNSPIQSPMLKAYTICAVCRVPRYMGLGLYNNAEDKRHGLFCHGKHRAV